MRVSHLDTQRVTLLALPEEESGVCPPQKCADHQRVLVALSGWEDKREKAKRMRTPGTWLLRKEDGEDVTWLLPAHTPPMLPLHNMHPEGSFSEELTNCHSRYKLHSDFCYPL